MGSFWEKVKQFFEEPDPAFEGDPVTIEGKTYVPYYSKDDPEAVWPNAYCSACNGLNLKKEMYWNKESQTYYHQGCISGGQPVSGGEKKEKREKQEKQGKKG